MRELFDVEADSVERFLVRWYGPPDREAGPVPNGSIEVPRPLLDWYELKSRWSVPLVVQNRLLGPDEVHVEDGKLIFWVENQGVWLWACDCAGDDPAVFDRENEPGEAWQPTGVALSRFLLHVAVVEAIFGAPHGASAAWVTPAQLDAVLAPLRPLPMPAWRWPAAGHRLYAGEGLLAFAGPNAGPGETAETAAMREVWLAARGEHLEYARSVEGVEEELEEKGQASGLAAVAQVTRPVGVHRPGTRPRLPADDHPVDPGQVQRRQRPQQRLTRQNRRAAGACRRRPARHA